jgi:hypothetical protein
MRSRTHTTYDGEGTGILTLSEAAEHLSAPAGQVINLALRGGLPSVDGDEMLFDAGELDAWLLAHPHRLWSLPSVYRRSKQMDRALPALHVLTTAGWSDDEIAAVVSCRPELISRWRAAGVAPVYRRAIREIAGTVTASQAETSDSNAQQRC